ncbi:MAG: hypothetical protein ACE5LH_02880 [Fidelibacterota bacterium]
MTFRLHLFFLFLPLYLAGQVLIRDSAPNAYLLEREAVAKGEIDPYFAGRISYEWRVAMPDGSNDLLFSARGDSWLRNDRLKIFPELGGALYLNGGNLKRQGSYADLFPALTLTARYLFPLLGRTGILFWGRFEKHSVLTRERVSGLAYDFSRQKEVGKVRFPAEDSTWVEYDIGDAGVLIFYPGGSVTVAKANPVWGTGYAGNLWLSDKPPSFAFVSFRHRFSPKWTLSFVHGTLNSGLPDSTYSGSLAVGDQGINLPLVKKFVVAHRLDFHPVPPIRLAFGESVIYGGRGRELQYLLPLISYWTAQHDLNDTDNLQWMIDAEIIRKGMGRLYGSLYMDEWDLMDTFNRKKSRNWWAYQIGLTGDLSSLIAQGSLFRVEFTHLSPYVYVHENRLNTFDHYGHTLGFWSGPNSDNLFVALEGTVKRGWWVQLYGQRTRRGEVTDDSIARQYSHLKVPFLDRSYDGPPETRILVGVRGELSLTTWFRTEFDLFSDDWNNRLKPGTGERGTSSKIDGFIGFSVGF